MQRLSGWKMVCSFLMLLCSAYQGRILP
uniref:Uncharacterized protein n=1 Tax=Arundo donax TaxID=35708 RepID=A0A0A9GU02_ARUDO